MNVEIINVGTELLLGEVVNTNATLLQKTCKDLGFNVYFQTVVGDNPKRLFDCLKLAFERGADCVMTTGGLGPTTDDLTKELSAQFLGLEMVYIPEEGQKVEQKCRYCTVNHQISDNNYKQAYFPQDAYILENDMGTANGCVMSKDQKMIINLPGPPKEISYIVEHSLIPYLLQYKDETVFTYEYMTMFVGESKLDEILRDLIDGQEHVSIALYAGEETVRVRLAVKTTSQELADQLMKETKAEIEKRIGEYIIPEKNLKEALMKIMVPISLEYQGDFHFKDDFFKPFISSQPQIKIMVDTKSVRLGEIVIFQINDYSFEVPTFVKASYSYGKVEARLMAQLYKYIIKHNHKEKC